MRTVYKFFTVLGKNRYNGTRKLAIKKYSMSPTIMEEFAKEVFLDQDI
jgi:hypothetical protein